MRRNRRGLLKAVTAIPVIGGVIAVVSPLVRYFKPNDKSWRVFTVRPDRPRGGTMVVGKTTQLAKPWDFFYFTYVQKYVQYDAEGYVATNIPGVAIRLPRKVKFADTEGYVGHRGETDIVLFSRICPHLGCIFNYVPDWHAVTAGYGGFVPPTWERHPLMACPCHFSIYDPMYRRDPGEVISGPVPRGARYLAFELRGEDIVVTGAEVGAIARAGPAVRRAEQGAECRA